MLNTEYFWCYQNATNRPKSIVIYSNTLHWSDITPVFDPVSDLDLITEFGFLLNCTMFPLNICNFCGMAAEDDYSSEHLVLSHFGTCMSSNVETILSWNCLFSDFWVSNIPHYFCFPWLHVPSGTLWSTSSDNHRVVEITKHRLKTLARSINPFSVCMSMNLILQQIMRYEF